VANSIVAKLWIAVRLVVFGVGGFWLMITAWVFFLARLISQNDHSVWPLVFAPMTLVGAALMLYGVGQWGRWWYLAAFLSIPFSMLLWFLLIYPREKMAGPLAPMTVAIVGYLLAKRHYSRRQPHSVP
jgi:hypothetical protein